MTTNLFFAFLTGLTTGGLTCLALQGSLLTSIIPQDGNKKLSVIISFLVAKTIAYATLGLLLGFIGQSLSLDPVVRGYLQIILGLYLLTIAFSYINSSTFFRQFSLTPPRFVVRMLRKQKNSQSIYAPFVLGSLTVFIPCATTQAMMIVALGLGSPIYSAAFLTAFVLGTSPVFMILGLLYERIMRLMGNYFSRFAFSLMTIMAVITLNNGLVLVGSIYTLGNFKEAALINLHPNWRPNNIVANLNGDYQAVTIDVSSNGYTPNSITLRQGIKTKITLNTHNTAGCSRAFTIPLLKIQKILPETGSETVEFTPTTKGRLAFSCSMGMYTGVFQVI